MPEARVAQSLDVVVRNIGGTIYVAKRRDVKQLNEVGAVIWRYCDGTHDEPEIARRVSTEYEVSAEVAARDVREFIAELEAGGFLARVEV